MKYNFDNKKLGAPRLYWKKEKGKKSGCVTVKCGDCNNKVEIYIPNKFEIQREGKDATLEIGGVIGSIEFWQKLLDEIIKRVKKEK